MKKVLTSDDVKVREKTFAEDCWLAYFNRVLYNSGIISHNEFKKMTEKIACRKSKLSRVFPKTD